MSLKKIFSLSLVLFLGFNVAYAAHFPKERINRLAHLFMKRNGVPGMALDIYYNGEQHILTYGVMDTESNEPVRANTIFELGSLTKTFSATVLAMFVEQGKIQLNEEIGEFLPGKLKDANSPIDRVTFEQLATHTASLPDDPSNFRPRFTYDNKDFFKFLHDWRPSYPIGSRYKYSDTGYGVLGFALAGVAKEDYTNLQDQILLEPLEMNDTIMNVLGAEQNRYAQGYHRNNSPAPHWKMQPWKPAAGALRSTPRDMMKYLEANLGVGSAPQNIKNAMQFAQKGYFKVSPHMTQGLAWIHTPLRNGLTAISKDGATGGFAAYATMVPSKQVGIIILANKTSARVGHFSKFILNMLTR